MRILFFFVMIITFVSCNQESPEYKKYDNYLAYKIIELGDGKKPKAGEVILLNIEIESLKGDTLHYVPDYNYFHTIGNHYLDSLWTNFEIGDRLILKINKEKLLGYLNFQKLKTAEDQTVLVKVKLINSVPEGAVNKMINYSLSHRELEEQIAINNYLKQSNLNFEKRENFYRYQDTVTQGEKIQFGSRVSLHYKGKFLNGYVFDDTYEKKITPSFTYGQKYQLIDGIYKGISGMREGERVKLILPSRHAFGGEGSLAAIVPPYTAVIYEVNIIKVIN